MTGEELIAIFKRYVDDALEDELSLDLLNTVKDMVEGSRPWRMLVEENSDNTFTASDDYTTAKTLPSDFMYATKVVLGIASAKDYHEYNPIAFEDRRALADSQGYCIDFGNLNMYIVGKVSQTYTIYLYYIKQTDALTLTTSPVWPLKFQRLIPLIMAEIHKAGIDADVWNLQQAIAMSKPAQILLQTMIGWDNKLKLNAMGGRTPRKGMRTGRITSGVVQDRNDLLR